MTFENAIWIQSQDFLYYDKRGKFIITFSVKSFKEIIIGYLQFLGLFHISIKAQRSFNPGRQEFEKLVY